MGNKSIKDIGKRMNQMITLQQEFDLSFKLLRRGLGELQNIDYANDFYFMPLLLLSQGIERFLKSYIIAYKIEKEENQLFDEELRTHDLLKLLDFIRKKYYAVGPRDIDIKDEQYLSRNAHLKRVLAILSDFGKNGRYYNINYLIAPKSISPIFEWEKLERDLSSLTEKEWFKPKDIEELNKYYKKVTNEVVIIIEKFLSILARQHIFGNESKVFRGMTMPNFAFFEYMYDGDYGKTDYTVIKKENEYNFHKRTFFDKLKTVMYYKHKKISRQQYDGEWPFKSDSIVLESRKGNSYFAIIDGYEYALDGKTASKLKLLTPEKGGVVIACKSTNEFLKIAKKL